MKKYQFILITLIVSACSHKATTSTGKVNYVYSNDGTITMSAIGIGSNKHSAVLDAEKNAFEVLFFRGLPESEQKIALIGANEIESKQKHQAYFNKFYKDQRFKTFLMSSTPTTELRNDKSIAVDVKINVTALRKDLEQNNIIRKFGY